MAQLSWVKPTHLSLAQEQTPSMSQPAAVTAVLHLHLCPCLHISHAASRKLYCPVVCIVSSTGCIPLRQSQQRFCELCLHVFLGHWVAAAVIAQLLIFINCPQSPCYIMLVALLAVVESYNGLRMSHYAVQHALKAISLKLHRVVRG